MLLADARVDGRLVDVRLERGRIAAIEPAAGRGGDLPLDGRVLVPGLWDEHVHLTQWALTRRRLDLSTARSAHEAAELVAAANAREPGDAPIVGRDFRDALWPDAPGVELLDAAAPARPVVLVSADLHCCWLNSLALDRFGHRGHPTGLLVEDDCFAVVRHLDDVPDPTLDEWVDEAARAAAARGVVGIVDLEMTWNAGPWERRRAAGFDALRVDFGVYPQHVDRAIEAGLVSGSAIDDLLTVGPAKILTDGSLNTRTAYCVDPYPGAAEPWHGLLTVPPDELEPWLRHVVTAGFVPAVHAIGDAANSLALDAFAAVGARGRIEHAQLLQWADVARFAALGVTASVQPEHAVDDRDVAERHWAGRTDRAFPLRALLDSGARLVLGSDAPVAPLDPWVTLAAAVGRTRGDREAWHPEQSITIDEGLEASTRSRVAVGEPADLVALDADPGSLDAEGLRRMPVALTVLGGRITHSAL